jgi:hypothetical protein
MFASRSRVSAFVFAFRPAWLSLSDSHDHCSYMSGLPDVDPMFLKATLRTPERLRAKAGDVPRKGAKSTIERKRDGGFALPRSSVVRSILDAVWPDRNRAQFFTAERET